MNYYSTKSNLLSAGFREAVFSGLAPDGGLWMPAELPAFPSAWIQSLLTLSFTDIAREVAGVFAGDEVVPSVLKKMVKEAFTFDAPLVPLDENLFVLELFHGPTLSFKDFGARFLARLLSHFLKTSNRKITILAATSGDTGSAVAAGFHRMRNIRVVLLYPSGKISLIQEKQMTTWGGNITAVEVDGTFDDCQALVKQAFNDPELKGKVNLASANSINIGRLIPQSFYYLHACGQLQRYSRNAGEPVFSVPSGNFGNLTSGLFAKRMGLPVRKFVASTNINDVFAKYLSSGRFEPRASVATISNAMDVGNPSNFARIAALYNSDVTMMQADITAARSTDEETVAAMGDLQNRYGYIADPHTAVAYLGVKKTRLSGPSIFLATAHPAKFPELVKRACGTNVEPPERLRECLGKEKQSIRIQNDYQKLKDLLS